MSRFNLTIYCLGHVKVQSNNILLGSCQVSYNNILLGSCQGSYNNILLGSCQGSYFQMNKKRWAYHLKQGTCQELLPDWSIYLPFLHMIGRSKMNECLPDMTPNRILLDVSVNVNILKRYNKLLILIRLVK